MGCQRKPRDFRRGTWDLHTDFNSIDLPTKLLFFSHAFNKNIYLAQRTSRLKLKELIYLDGMSLPRFNECPFFFLLFPTNKENPDNWLRRKVLPRLVACSLVSVLG